MTQTSLIIRYIKTTKLKRHNYENDHQVLLSAAEQALAASRFAHNMYVPQA